MKNFQIRRTQKIIGNYDSLEKSTWPKFERSNMPNSIVYCSPTDLPWLNITELTNTSLQRWLTRLNEFMELTL